MRCTQWTLVDSQISASMFLCRWPKTLEKHSLFLQVPAVSGSSPGLKAKGLLGSGSIGSGFIGQRVDAESLEAEIEALRNTCTPVRHSQIYQNLTP